MRRHIIFLLLAFCVIANSFAQEYPDSLDIPRKKIFNIGIFPCISTNGEYSEDFENNVSLSLIYGKTKKLHGFSFGFFNEVRESMEGVQIGAFNFLDGEIGVMKGLQIGISNGGGKRMSGVQVGFMNGSTSMCGVQIGFINMVEEPSKGVQLGIFNSQKESPLQIGIANVADHNDYPVGFVNIIKDGDIAAGLMTDELHSMIVHMRSGGRHLYGVAGLGYNAGSHNGLWVFEGGIGAHIHISDRFKIDMEFTATELTKTYSYIKFGDKEDERDEKAKNYDYKTAQKLTFRILPNIRIGEKIKVMGGPTLNYLYTHEETNRSLFPSNYLWRDFDTSTLKQLHLGWTFGICYYFKINEK